MMNKSGTNLSTTKQYAKTENHTFFYPLFDMISIEISPYYFP